MAELLLELLSEEIPARMQRRAAADLHRILGDRLAEAGLRAEAIAAYATPRRIAVAADGLPVAQPDQRQERKGPRVGAPDAAIAGFLKSADLKSLQQCEKRATDRGEFWFAVTVREGRPTAAVLAELLPAALAEIPWPKSMRWGDHTIRWVRPLHAILCVFAGKTVPFKFGHLVAGAKTRGHRFLAPREFSVRSFADYRAKLRKAKVMLDPDERAKAIRQAVQQLAAKKSLHVVEDEALLEEVVGLVEWPVALLGAIDDTFMNAPNEVLQSAMRGQQRYFSLRQRGGKLAPHFVLIANNDIKASAPTIVAGNERVLRARLSDASFFWDQDRKVALESRVPALAGVVFQARLGTMADKVERLRRLVVDIGQGIPGADAALCRRAALLAKADLTTGMVGEFPELQGIMGRYYALRDQERDEVADAIAEHYSPLGPSDRCPSAPTSVALALADKIDTLVGFFAIDERPTGSKDPFALRRAGLGIIRLILENGVRIPLFPVIRQAYEHYLADFARQRQLYVKVSDEFHGVPIGLVHERSGAQLPLFMLPEAAAKDDAVVRAAEKSELLALPAHLDLRTAVLDFLADRLKVHLREQGVRHDLVSAVFAKVPDDDLVRLMARVEALKGFLDSDDGANLLLAYRRAANIVRIESKKDGRAYLGAPDPALLQQQEENRLFDRLSEVAGEADAALAHEEFRPACRALARLRGPIDDFFSKVTVNTDDAARRANRLILLARVQSELNKIADFSKIEG